MQATVEGKSDVRVICGGSGYGLGFGARHFLSQIGLTRCSRIDLWDTGCCDAYGECYNHNQHVKRYKFGQNGKMITSAPRMRNRLMLAVVGVFGAGLLCIGLASVSAASANISHSYQASGTPMIAGSLVSLDTAKSNQVLPANVSNGDRLLGVAVGADDSLVSIDSESGKVQIATSGVVNTLVSTVNGPIGAGDKIAVSPFSGIGMKAQAGSRLIGLAQSPLNASSTKLSSRQVTDKSGKKVTIQVGYVQVGIAISTSESVVSDQQISVVHRLSRSLAGHEVSTTRVVISSFIAVLALIALVTLVYTSIYGTIMAVGRNPLAKESIFRALASVAGMALLTGGVAIAAVYLIVR